MMMRIALLAIAAVLSCAVAPAEAATKSSITRAERYYELGKWEQALTEYEAVYADMDSPDPSLIFQIAQCHRKLDRPRVALHFYDSFLGHPDIVAGGYRDLVPYAQKWKKEMEDKLARQSAPPPPKPERTAAAPHTRTATLAEAKAPPTAESPPPPRFDAVRKIAVEVPPPVVEKQGPRVWQWYAVAGAGVLGGTAVVLKLMANSANDDYHNTYARQGQIDPSALSRAETLDTVAAVTAGIAVTALVTAVVGFIVPDEEGSAARR